MLDQTEKTSNRLPKNRFFRPLAPNTVISRSLIVAIIRQPRAQPPIPRLPAPNPLIPHNVITMPDPDRRRQLPVLRGLQALQAHVLRLPCSAGGVVVAGAAGGDEGAVEEGEDFAEEGLESWDGEGDERGADLGDFDCEQGVV